MPSIRAAYDLSVLGLGFYQARARTGVARVIANLAEALDDRDHVEVYPCATRSLQRWLETICDVIPILFPEHFAGAEKALLEQTLAAIRGNDFDLAISESTKNDLARWSHARTWCRPFAASWRCAGVSESTT